MKKYIILIIILALGGTWTFWSKHSSTPQQTGNENRGMSIENFIRLNISDLSQKTNTPEVLGGTFYVTSIEASNGRGVVSYEDGHNAYIADFTYTTRENGALTIDSFIVRE